VLNKRAGSMSTWSQLTLSRLAKYLSAFRDVQQIVVSGRNYWRTVWFLVHRAVTVPGRAGTVAAVMFCTFMYGAAQGGAVGSLYWYVGEMEAGGMIGIERFGLVFDASEDPRIAWLFVCVSAFCFVVSASCVYFAQSRVTTVTEQDLAGGMEELVVLARRLPDPRAQEASRLFLTSGFKEVNNGSKYAAITVLRFTSALAPVCAGIGALGVLLTLDWRLTLLILTGGAIWSVMIYPLTLRAVQFSMRRDPLTKKVKVETDQQMRLPMSEWGSASLPSAREYAHVLFGRRRINFEMSYFTEVGQTIIATVATMYLVGSVLGGAGDWAFFIAFVGALRIALLGVFAGTRTYASVSRVYPETAAFVRFTKDARQMNDHPLGEVARGEVVSFGESLTDSSAIVCAGDRVAVVVGGGDEAGDPTNRAQRALLSARHRKTDRPLLVRYVGPSQYQDELPTATAIVVLDGEWLHGLNDETREHVLTRFQSMVTLVIYNKLTSVGAGGETVVLGVEGVTIASCVRIDSVEGQALVSSLDKTRNVSMTASKTAMSDALFDDEDE